MRSERLGLAAALAAFAASASGCYFLSSFDGLDDAGAATAGAGGAGGNAASTSSMSSTSSTSSRSSSTATAGQAVGSGGAPGSAGAPGGGGAACPPPGADYTGLVMNEMAPKGVPDDWIELRNNGLAAIPLCGVILAQSYDDVTVPEGSNRFTFGDVSLAPGEYLVVASGPELPYGLSKDAPERITLFTPAGQVLDDTAWVATPATEFTALESWARIPDGTGPWKRVENPTKGTANFELPADAGSEGGSP